MCCICDTIYGKKEEIRQKNRGDLLYSKKSYHKDIEYIDYDDFRNTYVTKDHKDEVEYEASDDEVEYEAPDDEVEYVAPEDDILYDVSKDKVHPDTSEDETHSPMSTAEIFMEYLEEDSDEEETEDSDEEEADDDIKTDQREKNPWLLEMQQVNPAFTGSGLYDMNDCYGYGGNWMYGAILQELTKKHKFLSIDGQLYIYDTKKNFFRLLPKNKSNLLLRELLGEDKIGRISGKDLGEIYDWLAVQVPKLREYQLAKNLDYINFADSAYNYKTGVPGGSYSNMHFRYGLVFPYPKKKSQRVSS